MTHIHLDPIGGIAGDMFVGALLDAWPNLAEDTIAACRLAGLTDKVGIEHRPFNDGVLAGSRFVVTGIDHDEPSNHHHDHRHWQDLRERLIRSDLAPGVRNHALAIFSHLAEAEAGVHGVPVDQVAFHEVGAWDSIADIVASAFLIDALSVEQWTISPLPLGSGRVRTAHGDLPVPAPATMRLLEGFSFLDDGQSGERVTPTGAAILKHLQPACSIGNRPRRLLRTGYGFGLRKLDGMSNTLRATAFEPLDMPVGTDEIGVISFEVDDQTAEDLAIGLEHLRRRDDVLDVLQMPAFGKKGRLVTALRLLVRKDSIEQAIEACFRETTTLGVRWSIEQRRILERRLIASEGGVAVKTANRPDGSVTAKAEAANLASTSSHRIRQEKRRFAEQTAIAKARNQEVKG